MKRPVTITKIRHKPYEKFLEALFLLCGLVSILAVAAITLFIFVNGLPAIAEIGVTDFIFGMKWRPTKGLYGIFPMIVGTLLSTLGAVAAGVPVGLLTAAFMAEYAPPWLLKILRPAVELLAGIPSVVYGFFGLIVIVPVIGKTLGGLGAGNSLLSAVIILAIMILPTVINTARTAIQAVPAEYREGSYALGASKEQTVFRIVLPAAKSGIWAGIVLGIGRAIGETMAIILVAGNAAIVPDFAKGFVHAVTSPIRTLTANIATEMAYASGLHQEALFATGVVLFVFILGINIVLGIISRGGGADR